MKNYYRIMLGKRSIFAEEAYKGNFIAAGFIKDRDLTHHLPDNWRDFNKEFIPLFLEQNPGKTKVSAGLACGMLWTVAKGIQIGDIVLCPNGQGVYYVGEVTSTYEYHKKQNKWHVHTDEKNDSLRDGYNKYIHVVFELIKNKKIRHLVFCDARKFGKVTLIKTSELETSKHLAGMGPEPVHSKTNKKVSRDISFIEFEQALNIRTSSKSKIPIKTFLMDTRTIAGIGNIYSDELLFRAGVHPKSLWLKIRKKIRKKIYSSMILVLKKGIDFGGDSTSDYRNIHGQPGRFHENHMAYQNKGKKCLQKGCNGVIVREVINGRSAHFCNQHQKLYN